MLAFFIGQIMSKGNFVFFFFVQNFFRTLSFIRIHFCLRYIQQCNIPLGGRCIVYSRGTYPVILKDSIPNSKM